MKASHIMKVCRQAFDQLAQEVESGRSDKLLAYLKAMGRFHRYSPFNQMLILSQRRVARQVAGFRAWKKLGRSVVKGARGIAIMAPIIHRKKMEPEMDDEEDNVVDLEVVRNFKVCYVFDASDTQGRPLPEFGQATGNPGMYMERLKSFIDSKGLKLETKHLYGSTQGYASSGTIVLKTGLSPAETCSTLLHELCHQLLHVHQAAEGVDRNIQEVEAEAVAFVVGTGIGLEMGSSSSDYISLYDGTKDHLLQSLQRIQMAASEILEAIAGEEKQEVIAQVA